MAGSHDVLQSCAGEQEDSSSNGPPSPILETSGTINRTVEQLWSVLNDRLNFWVYNLGIQRWNIRVDFRDSFPEDNQNPSFPITMFNVTMWSMQEAIIMVSVPQTKGLTDEEIEKDVLHELIHVIVNEIRWDTNRNPERGHGCACDHDHEERVVSELTEILWNQELVKRSFVEMYENYYQRWHDQLEESRALVEQNNTLTGDLNQANNTIIELREKLYQCKNQHD